MPEEAKKKPHKGRNEPKDQRRPRQRNQPGPVEKKIDKSEDENKAPQKPLYEEPGPEFYKNLKRETDEILKITEEENSKYKKKEIQSNWSKYEMPIESYDEIQEQENMGADYEKLIEAPLSIGGHFQFKHEKSWDVDTGPSPYDKYFEINMDNLYLSTSTIPFYERNNIGKDIFTETDILNMNNRATRFKQKYYNDKSFTTPDMEIQNSIIQQLSSKSEEEIDLHIVKSNTEKIEDIVIVKSIEKQESSSPGSNTNAKMKISATISDDKDPIFDTKVTLPDIYDKQIEINKPYSKNEGPETTRKTCDELENIDDILLNNNPKKIEEQVEENRIEIMEVPRDFESCTSNKAETQKPPVIESPEDLEKWLDDFLDG